mmetsp:Transcript_71775/g.194111  ORF Transcript_71775/g.194111 Transcript_71775/m.194111 type:complete len:239 (-) Transcript_71775:643-1359(-)
MALLLRLLGRHRCVDQLRVRPGRALRMRHRFRRRDNGHHVRGARHFHARPLRLPGCCQGGRDRRRVGGERHREQLGERLLRPWTSVEHLLLLLGVQGADAGVGGVLPRGRRGAGRGGRLHLHGVRGGVGLHRLQRDDLLRRLPVDHIHHHVPPEVPARRARGTGNAKARLRGGHDTVLASLDRHRGVAGAPLREAVVLRASRRRLRILLGSVCRPGGRVRHHLQEPDDGGPGARGAGG